MYAAKLKKDALERESKISAVTQLSNPITQLEQECRIDALERLSL